MLANVAQELQVAELPHPVVVVHHQGRIRAAVEIQESPQLLSHARHVSPQYVDRQQLPFFALAARITDHARGAAHQRDGSMPRLLKTSQRHHSDQVAHVQAVGRGIESHVQCARIFKKPAGNVLIVGCLVELSAPPEFSNDVHGQWSVVSGQWLVVRTSGEGRRRGLR